MADGIAGSIGDIVAEGLRAGSKGTKQEIKKAGAAAASQVTGQNYTVKTNPHQSQQIQKLKTQDEIFKQQELAEKRKELEELKQAKQQTQTTVNPSLIIEHHREAQKLDQPDQEEIKHRRQEEQKEALELEEKRKKEEEEKKKQMLIIPSGKQTGPNLFGKKPKKPLQVQIEQTKVESKHGVGG